MSSLNLKGIWIPAEILLNTKLSDKEKIIYSLIILLTNKNFENYEQRDYSDIDFSKLYAN